MIATRMPGLPGWRVALGPILPEVALQVGTVAALALGGMIAAISGFSVLGPQPPLPSVGRPWRISGTLSPWSPGV
ncbi:MAG: hypothetical protein AAF913_15410 [Pseudomonadota bacterium]